MNKNPPSYVWHKHLTENPNVVEIIILDHEGQPTKLNTVEAWCYLEINAGIIKGKNVRPDWKDPTPTGERAIMFGLTKHNGEIYDGCILLQDKRIAVFRLGKLNGE
jgi:hypothetical protein